MWRISGAVEGDSTLASSHLQRSLNTAAGIVISIMPPAHFHISVAGVAWILQVRTREATSRVNYGTASRAFEESVRGLADFLQTV